ncbi:MAG: hypothetical protein II333_06600 [Clostridia bacterium]|nr:hypothetical protein [Clostridia bacterium]
MEPVRLLSAENEHRIRESADPDFLFSLKLGLLTELKERGQLNETQYLETAERLREKFRQNRRKTP